jgi:hypothetical protein
VATYKARAAANASPVPVQADAAVAARSGHVEQVLDHRPADASAPRRHRGVHGLELAVLVVELPQRADAHQLAAHSGTEERDRRIEEAVEAVDAVDAQRVDVPGRRDLDGEGEVPLEERSNVLGLRILDGDDARRHGPHLGRRVPPGTGRGH